MNMDPTAVIADILNGIAMGALDAAIANEIREELDVEYAAALGVVKQIRGELNRNGIEYDRALSAKADIANAMVGATPLGLAWNKMVQESAKASDNVERLRAENKRLQDSLDTAEDKVEKINITRGKSAGQLISERGLPFAGDDVNTKRL